MKYILGAYSQLPIGSSDIEMENQLEKQIRPLLTMLYNNPDYKLTLRLGLHLYDYYESHHPEINMLINELCRKNQLEILTSSCHDVIYSLVPSQDRSVSIEKTTTYIRKHFSKKPNGFWCYYQIFNPSVVNLMNLCDLDYIVISSYNPLINSVISSKPFYMDEMGKKTVVFPTDDRINKLIYEFYRNNDISDKLLSETEKILDVSNNILKTFFVNLDQLSSFENINNLFSLFYSKLGGSNSTFCSSYIKEHDFTKSSYLPAGFYGRDFNPGKKSCINEIILDSNMLNRYYSLLNIFREAAKECRKNTDDRKFLDSLIQKASSGTIYIPENSIKSKIRNNQNKYLCQIESMLSSLGLLPDTVDTETDRYPLYTSATKNLICYISSKGACIARFNYIPALYDFAFHNGDNIFTDCLRDIKSKKTTELSSKRFELTSLDSKNQDIFAKCPTIEVDNTSLDISKRFKLRQNTLIVDIGIENRGVHSLKDYMYESNINICLPNSDSEITVDSNALSESTLNGTSACIHLKEINCAMNIYLSEIADISRKDVFVQTNNYEYTQIKIQKSFSLKPMEEMRFSIALKTDKNFRR